jgi:hypothetical protein
MDTAGIKPDRIINPPPPKPYILVFALDANVAISSGQSVPVRFVLERYIVDSAASLSVAGLPAGVTAALSPESLPPSADGQEFTLTLTAAPDVTPAAATIQVWAVAGEFRAHASVSINAKAAGQVRPSYQLLTVLYALPGTSGGGSSSHVDYGSGSTTGTTDSVSSSFKAGVDVTASAGVNVGLVNLGGSAEFTASQTSTDTSSLSISKSTSYQISAQGPSENGIDHGYDEFWLWLNPLMNVTIDDQGNVAWEIGVDGPNMIIQYVYARWLQDPSLMQQDDPGLAQDLAAAGLTTADFAQILACDPFTSGNPTIDPNRFVPTPFSFPYNPPLTAADQPPTLTYTQTSATTATDTEQTQVQYGVSVTVSAGIQVFFSSKLTVSGSLQWTDTSTNTTSTESLQSASVTIGGPAFGYAGPVDVLVYWDTVFSSFMFAFATGTPAATGLLTDSAGTPIPYKALTLTSGEHTLSTFTDPSGEYRFYGAAQGEGTITVDNQEFAVAIGPDEPVRTLRLTP